MIAFVEVERIAGMRLNRETNDGINDFFVGVFWTDAGASVGVYGMQGMKGLQVNPVQMNKRPEACLLEVATAKTNVAIQCLQSQRAANNKRTVLLVSIAIWLMSAAPHGTQRRCAVGSFLAWLLTVCTPTLP